MFCADVEEIISQAKCDPLVLLAATPEFERAFVLHGEEGPAVFAERATPACVPLHVMPHSARSGVQRFGLCFQGRPPCGPSP
eukprot:5327197-Lingulodinium_polyedra.AAC.1